MIDLDAGRAGFWAESAKETDGFIHFVFSDGTVAKERVLDRVPGERWSIEYLGSAVTIELAADGAGGTDLTLVDRDVAPENRVEVTAGWLNVLLPMKVFVDHGIDVRNHDSTRTWREGYVDQ